MLTSLTRLVALENEEASRYLLFTLRELPSRRQRKKRADVHGHAYKSGVAIVNRGYCSRAEPVNTWTLFEFKDAKTLIFYSYILRIIRVLKIVYFPRAVLEFAVVGLGTATAVGWNCHATATTVISHSRRRLRTCFGERKTRNATCRSSVIIRRVKKGKTVSSNRIRTNAAPRMPRKRHLGQTHCLPNGDYHSRYTRSIYSHPFSFRSGGK